MKKKWHITKHSDNSADLLPKFLPLLGLGHIKDAYLPTLTLRPNLPFGENSDMRHPLYEIAGVNKEIV